jgi:small subunit ribosomal protein S1
MLPNQDGQDENEVLGAGTSDTAPGSETTADESSSLPSDTAQSDSVEMSSDAVPAGDDSAEIASDTPSVPSQPEQANGLTRGELTQGTISEVAHNAIRIQLANGLDAVVPDAEVQKMGKRASEFTVGEAITVLVMNPRNLPVTVSISRAEEEQDWQQAETLRTSQSTYETKIAGFNKGGLIVRFNRLRGFVPQSQMNADRRKTSETESLEDRWSKMVNETIVVKVMEVDRGRNRLILSERQASKESREKRKENLISQLTLNEEREGRVVSLEDFGAFVDIGGAEGLVHLTELSWQHVTHPREVLKVGQAVKVRVISIDPSAKRIGLSIKQLESDPWSRVLERYNEGSLIRGTITKLTKFGAFAKLDDLPEIEGLIHISELAEFRVNHPKEVVSEGDTLTLRIVKIDMSNRRLGLSLKKVNSKDYLDSDWGG